MAMTREEAHALVNQVTQFDPAYHDERDIYAARLVASLVVLGLLRLEAAPHSAEGKFLHEMRKFGYSPGCMALKEVNKALENGGLQIVEKP